MVVGDGVAAAGPTTAEEVVHNPWIVGTRPTWVMKPSITPICLSKGVDSDSPTAMPSKRSLEKLRGLGLATRGCSVHPENLPSPLGRLPERSMASALLGELDALVIEVEIRKTMEKVGAS